jgi:hypothetical protein
LKRKITMGKLRAYLREVTVMNIAAVNHDHGKSIDINRREYNITTLATNRNPRTLVEQACFEAEIETKLLREGGITHVVSQEDFNDRKPRSLAEYLDLREAQLGSMRQP